MPNPQLQNMDATSCSFKYDVLPGDRGNPHIRLLELLPGKIPEPVRCNLREVPLGRDLGYEGLSYCWGDPTSVNSIYCNGLLFPVAANLLGAVEALREENTPRLLWVDAVCIDQTNIDERNQQVAIMRDIYSRARRTVVWLGPEAEGSNEALAIVPDLLAIRNRKYHGAGRFPAPTGVRSRFSLSPEEIEAEPGLKRLIQNEQARAAFLALLGRPWFSRVWIVQEVTVSFDTTVLCGSLEVPFDDLAQAAFTFDYLDLHVDVGLRRPLDLFWDVWDTRRKHWDRWPNSMFQLLLRHRWCHATDPRDKVYALCGIASDSRAKQLRYAELLGPGWYRSIAPPPLAVVVDEPDYRLTTVESRAHRPAVVGPDWSASDWFKTFRESIKNTLFDFEQGSDFWSPMMETPRPGPRVPPKERVFFLRGGMAGIGRDIKLNKEAALDSEFIPTFQASGDSQADVRVSSVSKTITLSGMVVDVIEEAGELGVKPTAKPVEFLNRVADWAAIASRAHAQVLAQTEPPEQSKGKDLDGNNHVRVSAPHYLRSPDSSAVRAWASTIMGGHIFIHSDAEALAGFDAYRRQLNLQEQRYRHKMRLAMAEFYASGVLAGEDVPAEVIAEYESYDANELRRLLAETTPELSQLRGDPLVDNAKNALGMGINRRFARGAKGYLALVPARGENGDEIVVFKGGHMPVLVRDRKEIIGECYVHGIMQGEVWREELCEKFVIH
ncbi:hypothetical protein NEMBOFW57_004542 [Staphylotrichum longicolle]|uniref:Heterokaryon incompatibility domain-containing protein n=1 Tax=Staphylotrichum longicolle TaxID=669026 RepID=A0AAD4I0K3_9PEZI|nr:hypothetical protein NEMBOFW57_004542 [Staphylotrichum longicolle]